MTFVKKLAVAAAASSIMAGAAYAQQGVTDSEILIGGHHDLSGPFAAFSAPAVQAANIVFEDVNANGGIHGRKIRYIVEDHGYQMPKAIQAINKLVNGDKVFAMLLSLGTPMNIAAFKLQDAKGIPNVSPLSAARQMNEPFNPLHYAGTASYYEQIKAAVPYLAKEKSQSKVCTMTLPTDFGAEIVEGAKAAAEGNDGIDYVSETTHKPDEADFVGTLQKLKADGCEIVALALTVRQAITVSGTAKKLGMNDLTLVNASAGFHTAIAKVPGGVTEGMYAAAGWADLLERTDKPEVQEFMKKFKDATGEELPGTGAVLGYSAAQAMVKALEAAGKDLTAESFQKGMESLSYDDIVSGNTVDYSPEDHQGADEIILSVIENGNWKTLERIEPDATQ